MILWNPLAGISHRKEARKTRERLRFLRNTLTYHSETFFATPTTPPNQPPGETQKIRFACQEDIDLAYKQGDLEMLEAYETNFSTTTGVRLTSICVDVIRMRGETPTSGLIEEYVGVVEQINQCRQRRGDYYHKGVPEERGGAAKLARFLLDHPEHEAVILQLVEQRGIPSHDDVDPLMQQLAAMPVLADGAL